MSLPNNLFAPTFRHQRLGWLFILIVAIMVYLATFAMAIEAAFSTLTISWDQDVNDRLTVEIPAVGDEASTPQGERIKQAISILRAMPDVQSAALVSDEETAKLLKPWISDPELAKKLPLPALIDVEEKNGATLTASMLEERVKTVVSDANVDSHAAWLGDLLHFIRGLTALAAFMLLLTGVVLFVTINLICRAVMATEKETVELLHAIGAADNDIARHFQQHAKRLSWPAALGGFALAAITLGVLAFFLKNILAASSVPVSHWLALGLITAIVPLIAVLGAVLSARLSVLNLLHHMP